MAIEFRQASLENGLSIIAEVDPDAHTAAAGFFVRTGARDESPAAMGVSHFLEHMMFKGTARRSAREVDRDFDRLGAVHNAFTTSELTAFWIHLLPEHLGDGLDILADIMRPSLRESDFSDERKVILEEIAMYRDQPVWVLYERAMEMYYGRHPLAHRVLGTEETISALSRDAMAAYFERRYSADNTVLSLSGRVDFDRMVERAGQACGHWQRTDADRTYPPFTPQPERFMIEQASVNRQYLLMLAPAPGIEDDDRYAAAILAQILGDTEGSRLYWSLIETGLADDAQVQFDPHDRGGEFCTLVSSSEEHAEEVESIVLREIDGLLDTVTEDDLVRVRAKIATSVTLHGELPAGRMRRIGQVWTYARVHRPLEAELARIEAVTLDELRSVVARYPMRPVVTGSLRPA